MTDSRLHRQLQFALRIDALKTVKRRTWLTDRSRLENSAEHSWHLALLVMLLGEYAPADVDRERALRMVLVHDLVEIEAGDTFAYDEAAQQDKVAREQVAADSVFGMLPDDQRDHVRALWDEFEARRTPTALFAAALDSLQPLMHNYHTDGKAWRTHGIRHEQVMQRIAIIKEGAPTLWQYAVSLVDAAHERGWLTSEVPE